MIVQVDYFSQPAWLRLRRVLLPQGIGLLQPQGNNVCRDFLCAALAEQRNVKAVLFCKPLRHLHKVVYHVNWLRYLATLQIANLVQIFPVRGKQELKYKIVLAALSWNRLCVHNGQRLLKYFQSYDHQITSTK